MGKTKNQILIKLFIALSLLVAPLLYFNNIGAAADLLQDNPIYIVQQGDTLNTIALRFGITADEILAANDIADPNALNVGQRIIIPGLDGIAGVLTSDVVSFGVSLNSLARQYRVNQKDLSYLNRITSPSETIAGVKFILPINEEQPPLQPIRTVLPGEIPLETAIRAETSPWILLENNYIEQFWDFLPGETILGLGDEDANPIGLIGNSQVSINNLPIIQGETLQISLNTEQSAQFSGRFQGETLKFFTDDGITHHSFHGIHALSETGPFPLQITSTLVNGKSLTFEQLVLISPGGYGFQTVTINEDTETYLDPTIIEDEDAFLLPILTQSTSERHWDGKFQYPIDEPCINSTFGLRRDYNNGGLFFYHTGMDFAVCAPNLNIYAPAAGEVVVAEDLVIRGKAILIDHGWGVFSGYWHLSDFNVNAGDFVQPGDLLGQIGDTGRSAGPHLHFEIDIMGTPVNPQTWLTEVFP